MGIRIIKKWGGLFLYYTFAKHLPSGRVPILGKVFNRLRRDCCKLFFSHIEKSSVVERNVYFGTHNQLSIGKHSGLGENFYIQGADLIIGNDVMTAPNITILGNSHVFDSLQIPMRSQGVTPRGTIKIGNDVWIGRNVTILPGCKSIGTGSIVGAGSVVTKSIPDYEIWAGNPAKLIKKRN